MGLDLGIYNPSEVNVNVQGRTIEGFAEDEMVRTERLDENEMSARVGAKGDFTLQKNLNKAGAIIITLKQNSPSNVFLQSLKEADSIFAVAITVKHNHQELMTGSTCAIGIAPRPTMGKEESDREWNIVVGELVETAKT